METMMKCGCAAQGVRTATAERMMRAMTYEGNRFILGWRMARASYAYTRSFDGTEGPDGELMDFGRWYAFKGAVELFIDYVRNPR